MTLQKNLTWENAQNDSSIQTFEHPLTEMVMSKEQFKESFEPVLNQLDGSYMSSYIDFFFEESPVEQGHLKFRDDDAKQDFLDLAKEKECIPSIKEVQEGENEKEKHQRKQKECHTRKNDHEITKVPPHLVETRRTDIKAMDLSEMETLEKAKSEVIKHLQEHDFHVESFPENDENIHFEAWKDSYPQRMVIGYVGMEHIPNANFLLKQEYDQTLKQKYREQLENKDIIRTYWQYETDGYIKIYVYGDNSDDVALKGIAFCDLLSSKKTFALHKESKKIYNMWEDYKNQKEKLERIRQNIIDNLESFNQKFPDSQCMLPEDLETKF